MEWTPGFVGLLLYVFAIVTYRAPIATPAILLALAGVIFGRGRVRIPPFLIAFGAFIVWGYVGYSQSAFAPVVWERLILLSKLWLIAFAAVNTLRTPAQIRFFLVFFLVCFATHPARGAIFNYFSGYTVFGRALWNHIYANPNDLAGLTLLPLGVAVALVKDVNVWIRRGAIVSIVVLIALILMTQSRGGFLALVLMGLLSWKAQRNKLRAFVAILVLGSAAAIVAPDGIWDRVSALSERGSEADSSSRQRWEIWQVARTISSDNPITGVGLGAYAYAHQLYTSQDQRFGLSLGFRDAHSTYFNVLAEAGWPGLLLLLLTIGLVLRDVRRSKRRMTREPLAHSAISPVAVSLVGFMAAGLFASYSHLAFLYLHLAVLTVLYHIGTVQGKHVPRSAGSRPVGMRRPPHGRTGIQTR